MDLMRTCRPAGIVAMIVMRLIAIGQAPARSGRPIVDPSLPGAAERVPGWLSTGGNAPFALNDYFAMPPADQNAAPLYLDALFEFDPGLASCFPAGPTTDARAAKALDRQQRTNAILESSSRDASKVDRAGIRSLLAEYQDGFRRLKSAQARPRCVFASGIGFDAPVPHLQAVRQAARVYSVAIFLDLEEDRIDSAIDKSSVVLGLAGDIQPRGFGITRIVEAALITVVFETMLKPVLLHRKVTPAQCARVLALVDAYKKRSIDNRMDWLKSEYVLSRWILRGLSTPKSRERLIEELGPDRREKLKQWASEAKPSDFSTAVAEIDRMYRELMAAARLPHSRRGVKFEAIVRGFPQTGGPASALQAMLPDFQSIDELISRHDAFVNAALALTAVRRRQLVQGTIPSDLAAACRDAGLASIPEDPYHDGKPLKFLVVDNEPRVYSVGSDGEDGGGLIDNVYNTRPGDLLFRLSPR